MKTAIIALLFAGVAQAQTVTPNTVINLPSADVRTYGPGQCGNCNPWVWWPFVTFPEHMEAIVNDPSYVGTLVGNRVEHFSAGTWNNTFVQSDGPLTDSFGNQVLWQETFHCGGGGRAGIHCISQGGTLVFNPTP